MHCRVGLVLFTFFLLSAHYAAGQDQSVQIPTNWKTNPNDAATPYGVKRYPPLAGTAVGYELSTCTLNFPDAPPQPRTFVLGSCPPPNSGGGIGIGAPTYTGFGGVPTTAFAVESSYRYTMQQLSPFLENLNQRVDLLQLKANSLNKRLSDDEAGLPGQIDQLAVQKLLDKINALEARIKTLESQHNAGKP
jgi:chaperonin cofactor prefoldin